MDLVLDLYWAAGIAVFLFGIQTVLFFPLTIGYEIWKRRFFQKFGEGHEPFLTVIVPAFNEEQTIAASVESILASRYPAFELIVVNDGSTDRTEEALAPFVDSGRITYITKRNGGKSSALNAGIARARGDIVFFTDADSIFLPDTLSKIGRWFVDPEVHAVCGNDTPLDPANSLQNLLAVTTHIGTGFVRRALSLLNVMPIISGNSGAVRKKYLEKVGGFTDIWGEDLDLTLKLQRERARIVYDSDSLVRCHVPRTFGALWKQRVRWTRSFIKIAARHKDLLFTFRYFPFSWYFPVNCFNLIGIPLLQTLSLLVIPFLVLDGTFHVNGLLDIVSFLGFGVFLFIAVYSVLLDRMPGHLVKIVVYGWLMVPITYFYNAIVLYSLYSEIMGFADRWEKAARMAPEIPRQLPANPGWLKQAIGPLTVAVILTVTLMVPPRDEPLPASVLPINSEQSLMILATHFDAWQKPSDAVSSIFSRDNAHIVTHVAVGAGRWEWNFFKWRNHEATWSNDVRSSGSDLLDDAISVAARNGRKVIAIVDFYAPLYLRERPEVAARDADGVSSNEQVCFIELVRGQYGRLLKEMVTYIAKSYDVEAISLTELQYSRYCYDDRCLEAYRNGTGARDWPREFFSRHVDRASQSIGAWRSKLMATFLHELADSVHAYGKKVYIDVPVEYDHLHDEGRLSGLSYPDLLSFADGLVLWDYFYLDGRPPEASQEVAKFYVDRYGPEKIIVSIGLWGKVKPLSPDELARAFRSARLGGARRIWLTPNHLVTSDHWKSMVNVIKSDAQRSPRQPPPGQ